MDGQDSKVTCLLESVGVLLRDLRTHNGRHVGVVQARGNSRDLPALIRAIAAESFPGGLICSRETGPSKARMFSVRLMPCAIRLSRTRLHERRRTDSTASRPRGHGRAGRARNPERPPAARGRCARAPGRDARRSRRPALPGSGRCSPLRAGQWFARSAQAGSGRSGGVHPRSRPHQSQPRPSRPRSGSMPAGRPWGSRARPARSGSRSTCGRSLHLFR